MSGIRAGLPWRAAWLLALWSATAAAAPAGERETLATSQGAVGGVVRDASFTAADGRSVRLADYRGKPLVVSLIYTGCAHICPTTTRHLAKVVRTARAVLGADSFAVLSIGFDTPNDTPAAMAAFARQQHVGTGGWEFLSADAATLARLTEDLGFRYARAPHGFDHVLQATVIDAQGRVYRQVYGMTFETPLLVEPLKQLVYATPETASLMQSLGNRIKLFCTVYDPAADRYRFDYSLFLGIGIGLLSLGTLTALLLREWRRSRRASI